jgi:hypothetical protein
MSIPQILLPFDCPRRGYSTLLKIYVSPGSAAAVKAGVAAIKRAGLDSIDIQPFQPFQVRDGWYSFGDLIINIRNDALDAADPEAAVKHDPRYGTDILETIWGNDSVLADLLARLPKHMLPELRAACDKVRGMLDSGGGARGIYNTIHLCSILGATDTGVQLRIQATHSRPARDT